MSTSNDLKAWEIVSVVLKALQKTATIGKSTQELNDFAEEMIIRLGGTCYNKGYKGSHKEAFPSTVCISVNSVIGHGFPSDYKLQNGDLVSFDLGVKKDGLCGDAAFTMGIGEISKSDEWLLKTAKESLQAGISVVKAGVRTKAIGEAMERAALARGFVTNRSFCGHAIGKEMHMKPQIPAFALDGDENILKEGMMICLEPMVTKKDRFGRYINEWTLITNDNKKSAIFEHQLLVTKDGCEILTTHLD